MTRKLILDLDTGIDDALALAYALASPELELIGVTATYGNVTVEQGARNSLSLLELFGRSDIPVYLGPGHAGIKTCSRCRRSPRSSTARTGSAR